MRGTQSARQIEPASVRPIGSTGLMNAVPLNSERKRRVFSRTRLQWSLVNAQGIDGRPSGRRARSAKADAP